MKSAGLAFRYANNYLAQRSVGAEELKARSVECPTCKVPPGEPCWQTWSDPRSRRISPRPVRTAMAHWRRMKRALGDRADWWMAVVGADV